MNEPTVKTETDDERRDRGRPSRSNRRWRPGRRDMIRLAGASMGAGMMGGFHAAALDAAAGHPSDARTDGFERPSRTSACR